MYCVVPYSEDDDCGKWYHHIVDAQCLAESQCDNFSQPTKASAAETGAGMSNQKVRAPVINFLIGSGCVAIAGVSVLLLLYHTLSICVRPCQHHQDSLASDVAAQAYEQIHLHSISWTTLLWRFF